MATKTYDAEGAAEWFPVLCAQGAPVAVLQNGVEHRERFAPYVEQARLLRVVIAFPAERLADGEVRVRGTARMRVEDTLRGREFASLFSVSPVKVEPVVDFITAAWWKLCLNSVGALNALTLKPASVMRDEDIGKLAVAVVAECVSVGRAEGAQLSDSLGEEILAYYRTRPPDAANSLLADRVKRSRCAQCLRANGASPSKIAAMKLDSFDRQLNGSLSRQMPTSNAVGPQGR